MLDWLCTTRAVLEALDNFTKEKLMVVVVMKSARSTQSVRGGERTCIGRRNTHARIVEAVR